MKTHTTIRSWGALALGVFFTAVTARTIFDDVWNGAAVTISHINAAAALVAAIAAGHMVWPALRSGRIPAALGLALIFCASTAYIVTSAASRNAEVSIAKAADVLKKNEERAALKGKLSETEIEIDEAKQAYEAAKMAATKECASGKAKRCDGRVETRNNAERDLEKAQALAALTRGQISLLGPEVQPFAGYKHASKVFEAAGMGEASVIEARLELLLPFALVLISELGTLVFLGMALGHRSAPATVSKPETIANVATVAERLPSDLDVFRAQLSAPLPSTQGPTVSEFLAAHLPENEPPQPPKGGRKVKKVSENVVQFPAKHPAIAALESVGGSVDSNRELARLMGVTDGESSKRWQEIEHLLDVRKEGKNLRIRLMRSA